MSLKENVCAAIHGHNAMAVALAKIAKGRADCGLPLAREEARQLARGVLIDLGLDWNQVLKVNEEMQPAYEAIRKRGQA